MAFRKQNKKGKVDRKENNGYVCAIYTRVSTDLQVTAGTSLQDQEIRGINYSIDNALKYKVYTDAGQSGALQVSQRPALKQLMEDVYNGIVKSIWVIDIDRISRDKIEGNLIFADLYKYGVDLIVNDQPHNFNDDNENLLLDIRLLFADYERNKITARMKRGLEKAGNEGRALGLYMPLGYLKDNNRNIAIDEEEAEVVRNIFIWYHSGMSCNEIAKKLNHDSVPTKRGFAKQRGLPFQNKIRKGGGQIDADGNYTYKQGFVEKNDFKYTGAVIYQMLCNPIYKGERRYGKNTFPVPAIIDVTMFDNIQTLRSTRIKTGKQNIHISLLKGVVKCNECLNNYFSHYRNTNTTAISSYRCTSSARVESWCGNEGIAQDRLNRMVLDCLIALPEEIALFIDGLNDSKITEHKEGKESMLRFVEEQESELKRAKQLLIKGLIEENDFIETRDNIDANLKVAKETLNKFDTTVGLADRKDEIVGHVRNMVQDIEKLKLDDQIKIVRALIKEVVVTKRVTNNDKDTERKIIIIYKVDSLSSYVLSNDINITMYKAGYREKAKNISFNSWRWQDGKHQFEFMENEKTEAQ